MKSIINSFIIAISMYSKIPMPRTEWNRENMKYVMCFFPLAGVAVGAAVYLWWMLSGRIPMSGVFNTAVMIMIPIAVTGGIHMDGLLDTADALSSCQPPERKLEILKDSNAGAFAVIVCAGYLLLDYGVWYDLTAAAVPVVAAGFVLSRALSGLAIVTFPLAKNSGLAAMFSNEAKKKTTGIVMVVYIAASGAFMIAADWQMGLAGLAAAAAVFAYYRHMAVREFGGITGDLAGFFLQICELAMAAAVIIGGRI